MLKSQYVFKIEIWKKNSCFRIFRKCYSRLSFIDLEIHCCIIFKMSGNIFRNLDSTNPKIVEDLKSNLKEQFNNCRESWMINGLYDYWMITNSSRAIDVIVAVKEPHDSYFFDRSYHGIKSENKLPHLTLLGYIVRKKPIWLFKIGNHALLPELLKLLQTETDIITVVSALLIINILLPFIPDLLSAHLPKLFAVFSKLAAVNANSNNIHEAQLVHLQISLYTLFHRLYGMFPCNFVSYLHKEYSTTETFPVFSHTVKPMFDTVRVNSLLITGTAEWEVQIDRWKNIEPHDIVISCAKLLMSEEAAYDGIMSSNEIKGSFNYRTILGALKIAGRRSVGGYCTDMNRRAEELKFWSPSARFHNVPMMSAPTTIPLTPITRGFEVSSPYSEHEGSSPPEAAIEATPETTPVRDYMIVQRPLAMMASSLDLFPKESCAHGFEVPITDRSFPCSPIKKRTSQFLSSESEVQLFPPSSMKKVDKLLSDRSKTVVEQNVIEVKTIGPVKSDLSSNIHYEGSTKMISSESTSIRVPESPSPAVKIPVHERRTSSGARSHNIRRVSRDGRTSTATVQEISDADEFEVCDVEQTGSPCSAGGLHMPDERSLQRFARTIRTRYYSQTYSESGCSAGTSPQDVNVDFADTKVRRTNSCPDMKKSNPNSAFTVVDIDRFSKQSVLEEKDDDFDEDVTNSAVHEVEQLVKVCCGTQTDEIQFPYEHLFLELFPPSGDHHSPAGSENSLEERISNVYEKMHAPSTILQKYVDSAVHGCVERTERLGHQYDSKFLANQLKLMSVQLQFEEHRREIHAERNRRLLGRSRRNKTLEEYNSALKDQVLLLQKELETTAVDLHELVALKETDIEKEKKVATYWKRMYDELEKQQKDLVIRCNEIESQLKEEKKATLLSKKSIFEGKAALIDVTNELRAIHKDARAAKDLRGQVAQLQAEILKCGELMIRYRRRLSELMCMPLESGQYEIFHASYMAEVDKLRNTLNAQSLSLDATKSLIADLRAELKNKENDAEQTRIRIENNTEEWKKQLKELKEKYDALKIIYNRELDKSQELEYRLNNAKLVNRLSQPPPRTLNPGASRFATPSGSSAMSESSTVTSLTSVASERNDQKSPGKSALAARDSPNFKCRVMPEWFQEKRTAMFEIMKEKKLQTDVGSESLKYAQADLATARPSRTQESSVIIRFSRAQEGSATTGLSRAQESPTTTGPSYAQQDPSAAGPSRHQGSAATVGPSCSQEGPAKEKSESVLVTKKKGRMECAETGQLRSSSGAHGDTDDKSTISKKAP